MISIEKAKCIGCGKCIGDCPLGSLTLADEKAEHSGECIHCGHCVASCPYNAVSIPEYDMQDVETFNESNFGLDTKQLLYTIKSRRSTRHFTSQKVEQEKLENIIQAGRYTATAVNSQGCRFIVVQNGLKTLKDMVWDGIEHVLSNPDGTPPETTGPLQRLLNMRDNQGIDYLFRNAPTVLYIANERTVDAGLAAQNMELAAVSQGLGVLFNGYLARATAMNKKACEWIGVQEKPIAVCMLVGYPKNQYMRTAPRKKSGYLLAMSNLERILKQSEISNAHQNFL